MSGLGDRTKYIGASDVPIIMGKSPFKTRAKLLREKKGIDPMPNLDNLPIIKFGNENEQMVADCAEMDLGIQIVTKTADGGQAAAKGEVNGFPIIVHLDGITNTDAVFEAKTASTEKFDIDWGIDVPEYYKGQVQCAMHFQGFKKAVISVGERIQEGKNLTLGRVKSFEMEYDPEFVKEMLEAIHDFVEDMKAEEVILCNKKLTRLAKLKAEAKELKDAISEIEDELKSELSESGAGASDDFVVTLSKIKRSTFDKKTFEKDEPVLCSKYMKESVTNRLTVKEKEKENDTKTK